MSTKLDVINSAKGWDLGLVAPTSNGGRMFLPNTDKNDKTPDVEISVRGRAVKGGIFFDSTENAVAYLEQLVIAGKASQGALDALKKRIAATGATQIVRGVFEPYVKG